jgi:hypothetical protein
MRLGSVGVGWKVFARRRDGMAHALEGGLWLHPFVLHGERMAHLVSSDRDALLQAGRRLGLDPAWLQHKPLKHPRHGGRVEAWHWDLRGRYLALAVGLAEPPEVSSGSS